MDWVCDGVMSDGGVQRGCWRAIYWPSTGVVGNFGKGQCGRLCREARVQVGKIQCKNIKMGCVWP